MREHGRKRAITDLAPLLLLGVFAMGILAVLLSGAGAYQRLVQRDAAAYDTRTCTQYLATKVRQAPGAECVSVTRFGQGDCLQITETIEGVEYWTRIYCHDGWLMELFTVADPGFAPEDGEKILQAESLTMTLNGGLLQVRVTDGSGTVSELLLSLRGGKEAAP